MKVRVLKTHGEIGRDDFNGREKDDEGRRGNAVDAIDG